MELPCMENQDDPAVAAPPSLHVLLKQEPAPQVDSEPMDQLSTDESDDNQEDGETKWGEKDRELQFLRRQVQDLQGALKARDMELFTLRERYELLLVAVEQQDEAIAAIYATTGTSSASEAQLLQYSALRESTMAADEARTMPCIKRTAKEMLKNHLDSMGFDSSCVGTVLDSLQDKDDAKDTTDDDTASPPTSRNELAILNTALDKLVCPEPAPTEVMPEYANASTFLARRPSRRSGRRLSVSDFGLLETIDATSDPESGGTAAALAVGSTTTARRMSDPLFAGLDVQGDDATDAAVLQGKLKKDWNDEQLEELTYSEFLERLSLPGSKDIVHAIRRFVGSVLGPRGDGCPPTSSHFVDYIFYGHESFQARAEAFFRSMDETLAGHPSWRHAPESTLKKARDGIEKYVMEKLADVPLAQLSSSVEWQAEDAKLMRRMQLLSTFVTPDMLDIKPSMRNEVVWSIAQDELRRINHFRAPGDKINCIVRCCSIVFSVLNLARGDSTNRPGADDFLPVFIYLVLHSHVPGLYSNSEYIAAYRNPADLMSKYDPTPRYHLRSVWWRYRAGYCFVNLRSAIEFITVLDASMLSIEPEDFDRHMAAAEAAFPDRPASETKDMDGSFE
ncbi:Aste57867_23025 [Aphanomyces stellatus]|uniref:Aste57867_23025 protein n=1 Tax=Aphanomyces stellatus TaxID=120398 RepID=A0A485LLR5_9STRA|nr:hypothetical protein As57867_022954 [Aphanomyces stellatus]VFT99673.1 Aste57867_23025 [Aphanomyces stellatus]